MSLLDNEYSITKTFKPEIGNRKEKRGKRKEERGKRKEDKGNHG